jgi:putative transcriptional regulator
MLIYRSVGKYRNYPIHLHLTHLTNYFNLERMNPNSSFLQGKLILDSGKLAGSFFEKAVILICRHNEEGAFGLVLNRPVQKALGIAIQGMVPDELAEIPLYLGGPVQPEYLSFLYETDDKIEYDILPRINLGHSIKELHEYLIGKDALQSHAFAGYAGWSAGQLENELATGSWIVQPGSHESIFHSKPENLWRQILRKKGGIHLLQAECPDDPSRN